jgi:hypothetical protein
MKEMKDIIVEPPQPPPWFLEFQQAVFARFDKQDKRFDQIEADIGKLKADIKKMDTTRPTWFSQWVKSEFDPLKHRIDNIVKLNNLKE